MRLLSILGVFAITVSFAGLVRAQGVLQRLPPDRAWAKFDMKISDRAGSERDVSVTIKSVGQIEDAGEKCRWLEFTLPIEDSVQTIKLLVPERHCVNGRQPLQHVRRAWRQLDDELPHSVHWPRGFWLPVLLAGPFENVKKLDPKTINGKLGALKCQGFVGTAEAREDNRYSADLTWKLWRHERAPFGVVSCRIECKTRDNGKLTNILTLDLELADSGTDAKTKLVGYQ